MTKAQRLLAIFNLRHRGPTVTEIRVKGPVIVDVTPRHPWLDQPETELRGDR